GAHGTAEAREPFRRLRPQQRFDAQARRSQRFVDRHEVDGIRGREPCRPVARNPIGGAVLHPPPSRERIVPIERIIHRFPPHPIARMTAMNEPDSPVLRLIPYLAAITAAVFIFLPRLGGAGDLLTGLIFAAAAYFGVYYLAKLIIHVIVTRIDDDDPA